MTRNGHGGAHATESIDPADAIEAAADATGVALPPGSAHIFLGIVQMVMARPEMLTRASQRTTGTTDPVADAIRDAVACGREDENGAHTGAAIKFAASGCTSCLKALADAASFVAALPHVTLDEVAP